MTLSASLTDIGFITWKGSTATANPDEFVFDGFHHIGAEDNPETGESALDQEMDQLEDDLKALARFKNEEDSRRTQSLTTTLNIGGEYSVLNRIIKNVSRVQNNCYAEIVMPRRILPYLKAVKVECRTTSTLEIVMPRRILSYSKAAS